jgi:peptidoglycan/LPS O-acetylase OafA/YrhL
MNYKWKQLSIEDSSFYKGIGMLLITFHNFFHWVNPGTSENEFGFNDNRIVELWGNLLHSPLDFINLMFSYFGHFGVQIFIFLSGYGLMIAYHKRKIGWTSFVFKRLTKLYPALIISIIILILIRIYQSSELPSHVILNLYLLKLSFLSNFFPRMGLSVNGPWWFYSMIIQLYFVFPFLLWVYKKTKQLGLWIIVLFSYAAIVLFYDSFLVVDLNIYMLFIGHLPEFILGMIMAMHPPKKSTYILLPLAVIVFALGNFYKSFWYFSFLPLSFIIMVGLQPLQKLIRKAKGVYKFILFFGEVSMYTFAIHGFLRAPFVDIANNLNSSTYTVLIAIVFVTISTIMGLGIKSIEAYYQKIKFSNKWTKYSLLNSANEKPKFLQKFIQNKANQSFIQFVFIFIISDIFLRIYGIIVIHYYQDVFYNSWYNVLLGIYDDISIIAGISILFYFPVILLSKYANRILQYFIYLAITIWLVAFVFSVNNLAIYIDNIQMSNLGEAANSLLQNSFSWIIFGILFLIILEILIFRFIQQMKFHSVMLFFIFGLGLFSTINSFNQTTEEKATINMAYILEVNPLKLINKESIKPKIEHKKEKQQKNSSIVFGSDFESNNPEYYAKDLFTGDAFSGNKSIMIRDSIKYSPLLDKQVLPKNTKSISVNMNMKFKHLKAGAHQLPLLVIQVDTKDKKDNYWNKFNPFNTVLLPLNGWTEISFKQTVKLKATDSQQSLKIYFLNPNKTSALYDDLFISVLVD